jgi:ParB-like chromosome segregation protein Spo0J
MGPRRDGVRAVFDAGAAIRPIEIASLGERLAVLRLCEPSALTAVRASLERHGQLTALTLFPESGALEIVDGFKRVRAARALGWPTLLARIDDVGAVEAKLRLCELHDRRGLTELEEAWLVRSLYRDDGLDQPEIARRMLKHKSWVCRRLMLVESLDPAVQADVRLGLLAPRAAVAVARLPRGNQLGASTVVIRRGLTVRQTDLLVDEVLELDAAARTELLARRMDGPITGRAPGVRPARAVRNEADWMSADVARIRDLSARLSARLLATPLATLGPGAAEILGDALVRLSPVLRALDGAIGAATGRVAA